MSKMFYTLGEAASKLGKSEDEVKAMVTSGQLQEFRDRDSLMFKVDQVDLLSDEGIDEDIDLGHSPNDMSSMIPLADSFGGDLGGSVLPLADDSGPPGSLGDDDDSGAPALGGDDSMSDLLAASATGGGLGGGGGLLGESEELSLDSGIDDMLEGSSLMNASDQSKTGVSIFDADELEQSDPSAVTQLSDGGGLDDLNLDPIGSGSGLMDLTRESDDTSLGAEFLEEVYPGEEGGESAAAAASAPGEGEGGGGLFGGEEEVAMGGGPAMQLSGTVLTAETYDGGGSGLAAGLSIGAILALALGLTAVIFGMMGVGDGGILSIVTDNFVPVMGGLAGATLLFGIIGWVIGRRG